MAFPSPNLGLSLKLNDFITCLLYNKFPSPNLGLSLKLYTTVGNERSSTYFRPLIWGYL